MYRRKLILWTFVSPTLATLLTGCAGFESAMSKYNVERHTVQSFDLTSTRLRGDSAFAALTSVFVERGFDIKVSNKESGLVTTEYKKFASAGNQPPFDYYVQFRATVRDVGNGRTLIRLTPLVKEQNRLNSAAFTERELYYHVGELNGIRAADRQGWVIAGQTMFLNVVGDLAGRAGVAESNMVRNTTTTKFNALGRV